MNFDQPPKPEKALSVIDTGFYTKHFLPEDQKRMHSKTWDYTDEDAQLNKWRRELDALDESDLNPEQVRNRNDALWMWYHHASQFAHQAGDAERAIKYIDRALDYRDTSGPLVPNQITPLLKMLYQGQYAEAREFIDEEIPDKVSDFDGTDYVNERPNIEKETANGLLEHFIQEYPTGG